MFRHTPEGNLVRLEAKNKNNELLPVTVRVAKGLLTIQEVKLRLSLHEKKDVHEKKCGTDKKPLLVVVQRRRDTVSIGSNGRIQKVFLRFRNEAECREFSDAFVKLNPPLIIDDQARSAPKEDSAGEVLNYVTRLLNEPDFLAYVDSLEKCILSSDDGRQMLESLL